MKQIVLLMFCLMLIPICSAEEISTSLELKQDVLEVDPGGNFTVDLYVTPSEGIRIVSVDLKWDSEMLEVISVNNGDLFDSSTYWSEGRIYVDRIENIVWCSPWSTTEPGVFASIKFKTKYPGDVKVSVEEFIVSDTDSLSLNTAVLNSCKIDVLGDVQVPVSTEKISEEYMSNLFVMIALLAGIMVFTSFALKFTLGFFIKNINGGDKKRIQSDSHVDGLYSEYDMQRLVGEKNNQIDAIKRENEQNKQKLLGIHEKIESAPPEIKGFVYGKDYEPYDLSKTNQKIENLKKNWSKYKSTHAVEAFQPVFITLDKIAKGEDAYFYEGRPYYSVDKIVDCFGEMLNRIKGYEYLWKALEWLKKTYG